MRKRLAAGIVSLIPLTTTVASATTTSCISVAACLFGSNKSSGIGVEGSSTSGFGISGVSSSGHGVNGTSATSFGVVGVTTEKASSKSNARAGVLGKDSSTNGNSYNSGVAGSSKEGYGVSGSGSIGVYGSGAKGVEGQGAFGGYFQGTEEGVFAYATGSATGLFAYSSGSGTVAALQSIGASADLLAGFNNIEQVVSIDAAGNETLRGSLTVNGSPKVRTRSSMGADVAAFGAETAAPSIDDFGQAQLHNGVAYVALDRTFASTIDPHASYLVFITPEGDSNGLYTAALTITGFAVHENRGGRSSIGFAYRIVAKPLGAREMHLPPMTQFRELAKHSPTPTIR